MKNTIIALATTLSITFAAATAEPVVSPSVFPAKFTQEQLTSLAWNGFVTDGYKRYSINEEDKNTLYKFFPYRAKKMIVRDNLPDRVTLASAAGFTGTYNLSGNYWGTASINVSIDYDLHRPLTAKERPFDPDAKTLYTLLSLDEEAIKQTDKRIEANCILLRGVLENLMNDDDFITPTIKNSKILFEQSFVDTTPFYSEDGKLTPDGIEYFLTFVKNIKSLFYTKLDIDKDHLQFYFEQKRIEIEMQRISLMSSISN